MVDSILFIIEIIGIVSFSYSGSVIAIDKETDLFGVVFLAVTTCFGGGIIRDITLGITPPSFYVNMAVYVTVAIVTSLTVFFVASIFKKAYARQKERIMRLNNYIDALGLGVFTIMGVQICLNKFPESGPFLPIMMGLASGVGGGMIRDLILNDIPFVLRKHVYALATLIGSTAYYFVATYLCQSDIQKIITKICCILLIFVIRVLATVFRWKMPKAIRFKIDSQL